VLLNIRLKINFSKPFYTLPLYYSIFVFMKTFKSDFAFIFFVILLAGLLFSGCEKDPFEADSGTFTDKRDGHEYKWVKIGEQIWMAENLAYLPVQPCAPDSQCGVLVYGYEGEGSYGTNFSIYGCLYDWETAQNVCPEGWHLPSDEEWMELEQLLGLPFKELDREWDSRGENENVGGKLKETGFTHWNKPNEGATDEFGFCARPGGIYAYQFWDISDRFWGINDGAIFWTASQTDSNNAMFRLLGSLGNGINRASVDKRNNLSVRCIKN
jgi:uncharacterized protein (TIGR02145 family)